VERTFGTVTEEHENPVVVRRMSC